MQRVANVETYRPTAIVVGVLFLLATSAYMVAGELVGPALDAPDYLANIAENQTRIESGVLLMLVTAAANVGIGVLLFPILKRHSERIALGYLVTRIFDGAGIAISGIATSSLILLSREATQSGAQADPSDLALGDLMVAGSDATFLVTMIILGLGAMPFCYLLYRSHLVPRPLAALGLVGYVALFAGSTLELLGVDLQMIHFVPGGLFEILLPMQLIFRGFNRSALAPDLAPAEHASANVSAPAASTGQPA